MPATHAASENHANQDLMAGQVDPSHILQVGMGFWGSKALLSAVELELFTKLGRNGMTGPQIAEALELHERAIPDFPDALVALELLDREGEGGDALYRNSDAGAVFLDKGSPAYIGGILEMANARLYPFWGDLTEALRTGTPQNEIKRTGKPMFEELYADEDRLEQFMNAMAGISMARSRRWRRSSISRSTRRSATWVVRPASSQSSSPTVTATCAAPPSTCPWSSRSRSEPLKPPD
jgi:hypothetical protein